MKQIYPDLWQTELEHPAPAYPTLTTRAYLLTRTEGNVLIYSTGHAGEHREIWKLGGITHQYLSHRDEAGPALAHLRQMFGSKLCCHRLEVEETVRRAGPMDLAVDLTFDKREIHLGTIEVIPTPGHTNGSTCFLVRSPHGKSYLFTGDTIFLSDGAWETFVMEDAGGTKADLKASLKLLRDLTPDVVLSSASLGPIAFKEMAAGEWRSIIEGVLGSLS